MSSAFIPVFTEYQTLKSKQDAWELASAVFTTLLTIVTGITTGDFGGGGDRLALGAGVS